MDGHRTWTFRRACSRPDPRSRLTICLILFQISTTAGYLAEYYSNDNDNLQIYNTITRQRFKLLSASSRSKSELFGYQFPGTKSAEMKLHRAKDSNCRLGTVYIVSTGLIESIPGDSQAVLN